MDFLINAVDITFMAKCSAYEQYIKDVQQVSTSMVAEGATEAEKATNAAENNARTKLMSDEKFKNIFKFVQFVFDAACKNSKLFSELKDRKKADCGKHVQININSGGTVFSSGGTLHLHTRK
ncbi:uncharacterized protein LOC129567044 [Sitodiplosis mosellana]|uniref:uncharacterized protein LOC129567044 n=1 Tax=Sitodiplosis mosellana TaxID=263140 RepID=UPI002443CAD4|nr:uncharacterized protein LOC129567044 [Sitodiplosis mosellana]